SLAPAAQVAAQDRPGISILRDRFARRPSGPVQRGMARLDAEDLPGARAAFEEAIRLNPRDAVAMYYLGATLHRQGELQAAEQRYRAAIRIDGRRPAVHNDLGLLLRQTERLPDAITSLRRAVQLRRDFGEAHYNLAMALEEHGDVDAAESSYRDAVRLLPREPMARANLGLLLVGRGEREPAARLFREALPMARRNRAVLLALGNGLRRAGDAAGAVEALRLAVATGGDPTPALLTELALAELASGDRPAAERSARRAIGVDPRYPMAHYVLGSMLAARAAYADALTEMQRFLELEPSGERAEEARRRVEAIRQAMRAGSRRRGR
ncbi:MAG: tetratricopeptide repeat protein, partial [Deltaproteobacteria bacterium]|nr:tetratricopeptide repeat protein [Deltaproteobacteria bacterium]